MSSDLWGAIEKLWRCAADPDGVRPGGPLSARHVQRAPAPHQGPHTRTAGAPSARAERSETEPDGLCANWLVIEKMCFPLAASDASHARARPGAPPCSRAIACLRTPLTRTRRGRMQRPRARAITDVQGARRSSRRGLAPRDAPRVCSRALVAGSALPRGRGWLFRGPGYWQQKQPDAGAPRSEQRRHEVVFASAHGAH